MNVKLLLVTEGGEVLDSTDLMTAAEWNVVQRSPLAAVDLLMDLPAVTE